MKVNTAISRASTDDQPTRRVRLLHMLSTVYGVASFHRHLLDGATEMPAWQAETRVWRVSPLMWLSGRSTGNPVPLLHPQGLQGLLLGAAILSSYELVETFETYSPRYQPSSHIPLDSKWLPMELRTVVSNRPRILFVDGDRLIIS
jgi:hypothetical protein